MIKAIFFDFNGVIADDETPHLRCFQQALAEHGLSLTKDDYYGMYLAHNHQFLGYSAAMEGRQAIAEMKGRWLLLGPDCSINPDTPEPLLHAAGAAAREVKTT